VLREPEKGRVAANLRREGFEDKGALLGMEWVGSEA
jgi:hypothetical protein